MSDLDKEILNEFVVESKGLITGMIELLEGLEGDFSAVARLGDYGNHVDRIMGGAKNLALMVGPDDPLHLVADYTALCKAVGYKASQIQSNPQFYDVCVAFLLDATETLDTILDHLDLPLVELKKKFPSTFIERLRWISNEFSTEIRASVGHTNALDQGGIDELMKKLGFG
jgi:hypothetical protein